MYALGLFLGILVLDQLTKALVSVSFLPGESLPLIDGIFHITYVLNPGAAFGMMAHQNWFFVLAALIILGAFVRYYRRLRRENPFLHYGCIALLAGTVGNLIDRLQGGLVIDFFDFRVWPVFNLADIAIVGGVISMAYAIIFKMKETDE